MRKVGDLSTEPVRARTHGVVKFVVVGALQARALQ